MTPARKVSKWQVAGKWALMLAIIVGVSAFFFIRRALAPSPEETEVPEDNPVAHAIFFLVFGAFTLACGVMAYVIVLLTSAFTFNFNQQIWKGAKTTLFVCNYFVIVGIAVGLGLLTAAFFGPVFRGIGLPTAQANLLPMFGAIIVFQIVQLWVLIWAPVEKRLITNRLAAMGITKEQLKNATLVGLSNPSTPRRRQLGIIEEDVGALWVTADRLAYRGDVEEFDLARDHIVQIERQAMKRSNTMLAGIEHVILHVQIGDGSIRQVRLHVEGLWSLGQKRLAMDALAYAITNWHAGVTA
jgi:hypothetical protein